MLQRIMKRFTRQTNIIYKKYPPCGREICLCLLDLDLTNQKDRQSYLDCYETWFNYMHMNRFDNSNN